MRKIIISLYSFMLLLIVSMPANAALFEVTVTGDGILTDGFYNSSNVGPSSMSFSYDDSLFLLSNEIIFSGGTGKRFTTSDHVITVLGGGVSYSVDPFNGASIFDQPGSNDQFNYEQNGNILMQWNDFTSSAFSNPLPADFSNVNNLFIDQVNNNPNLLLSNNSVFLQDLNGNNDLSLEIINANVSISAIPIPAAAWLFGSTLLGFVGFARRRSV